MNALIVHTLPTLIGVVLKSTLVLMAAALACLCLRRSSAATRHLVWVAALAGVLLLPLLSVTLPRWDVAWRGTAAHTLAPIVVPQVQPASKALSQVAVDPAPLKKSSALDEGLSPVPAPALPPDSTAISHQGQSPLAVPLLVEIGISVWAAGVLFAIARFVVSLHRVRQIGDKAVKLDGAALGIAEAARQKLGIRRAVFLQASEGIGVAVPVTWGVLRPVVLLPAQSSTWSEECLRAALLHELAHVRRWDWATQLMTRLVCALYWWHPLVWWAARRSRGEGERACDDIVLGTGMKAADYAQRLVEVVRSMPSGTQSRTAAIAMAQPSEVEGRLTALLAQGRDRRSLSAKRLTTALALVATLLLPLGALRPVARAAGQNGSKAPTELNVSVERRAERGVLRFVYLKDVATDAFLGRPCRLEAIRANGHDTYRLFDTRTGLRARDWQTVQADFQKLLDQGYSRRAGATPYLVPLRLSIDIPTRDVFFTPAQIRLADELGREKKAFLDLMEDSPVIITDAEVKHATALMNNQVPPVPAIDLTLTPEGAKKLRDFTASHKGEMMGIEVAGEFVSAPIIVDPIDGGILSGNFHDLAHAKAAAASLNQPTGTEWITPTGLRETLPDGTQIVMEGGASDSVPSAAGYQVTLPNSYTVGLVGLTQAVAAGSAWNMYGGPTWSPNGTPLREPLGNPKDGLWQWSVHQHDGDAPFVFKFSLTPIQTAKTTVGQEVSTYEEFIGADRRPDVFDRLPFTRGEGAYGGATIPAFFAPGTRTCSVRCGVASGPWRTMATLPVHLTPATVRLSPDARSSLRTAVDVKLDDRPALMYQGADGTSHRDYFLGEGHLGNVARRVVAVDASGHDIPLRVSGNAAYDVPMISLGFGKDYALAYFNPSLDLARVREFRLETRPYQIVEFRDVQLYPREGAASATDLAKSRVWRKREEADLSNMRRISTLILEYTQDHDERLPSLKTIFTLQKDLMPYQKQQEMYPDPTTHQPYQVQGEALFISPLTGKPYRPTSELSDVLIAKIQSPTSTVLLKNTVSNIPLEPGPTQWVIEAFADGHVKGRAVR